MEPKEKAEELIRRFSIYSRCSSNNEKGEFEKMNKATHLMSTKECAYICCDSHLYSENDSPFGTMADWKIDNAYWLQVKEEVNKWADRK